MAWWVRVTTHRKSENVGRIDCFDSQSGLHRATHSDLLVERCHLVFDIQGILRWALSINSGGNTGRPGEYSCRYPPRLYVLRIAPLFSIRKNEPILDFSIRTEIFASPRNTSCSNAHQLQEKVSNVRPRAEQHTDEQTPLGYQRAASGLSADYRGLLSLNSQNKYHEARLFDTQRRNKPENFSGDHTAYVM